MDYSREADMDTLIMVIHNPDESLRHKLQAQRAIERIKRKMKDPILTSLRRRMIAAQQAQDVPEVDKISNLVMEYELKTYGLGR